jgi:hypothetical protein
VPKPVKFAKGRLVASGWPDDARMALIIDIDGDGLGDLVAIDPRAKGGIEFARNIRNGKFGAPATGVPIPEAMAIAPFKEIRRRPSPGKAAELIFVRKDGVRVLVQWVEGGAPRVELIAPPPLAPSSASQQGAGAEAETRPAASSPASRPAPPAEMLLWREGDTQPRGDFDGDGLPDEIANGKLVMSSDPEHPVDVPLLRELPPRARVVSGDFQGDHRDDLLVLRYDDAWRVGRDLLLYLAYTDGDPDPDGDGLDNATEAALKTDPLDADTDHDGLLDGWEVKGEGGIDLPALGASPTHKDCVVYLQRNDVTNGGGSASEIARAVKYWASLPNKNPDGTTGMHLIPIWLGPLASAAAQRPWWELGNENLPLPARGIAHYITIGPGGGGQSSELGDMGGCGEGALYATFLHEFGHQVGLGHAGGPLPGLCPTYGSLMNYAYSYGFNDDYNQIHYSAGELASLVLNEEHLPERVALPYEKMKFLEKGPYRFRLKADNDGTFVDWNRNGTFDPGTVRADITDTYGASGGERHPAGKTIFAPSLASHKDQLFVFGVNREKKLYGLDCTEEWKPGAPTVLPQVEPTGDPWATSEGERLTVLVPTKAGIAALSGNDLAALAAAPPSILPDSAGCEVSAATWGGKIVCILWRGPDQPVRAVERDAAGAFGAPRDIVGLASVIAPSAVEDPTNGQLIVGHAIVKKEGNQEKRQWRASWMKRGAAGGFEEASMRIVGGEKSGWVGHSRPVLVFESGKELGPKGRLHFIGVGWYPNDANGCFFEAITIGDPNQDDGWRLRRFYDEWTTTKSPIGACWHRGDIALVFRWCGNVHGDDDENMLVSFHGLGIDKDDMRDFDDVTEIAEVGLAHSLGWRNSSIR